MTCSCPDWAGMCKHVAAVMYGAGARLDIAPDLLFTLRGVDRSELIVGAGADLPMTRTVAANERLLAEDDVAALFGIEMAPAPDAPRTTDKKRKPPSQSRTPAQAAKASSHPRKETAPKAAGRRSSERAGGADFSQSGARDERACGAKRNADPRERGEDPRRCSQGNVAEEECAPGRDDAGKGCLSQPEV